MVTLLAKIFIQDSTEYKKPGVRNAYGVLCGIVGIILNILLFTGKFIAGTISNSIAVTADAFNNLSDAGSSLVTLLGFKLSAAKPDPQHPFGHGRIEYLSGLIVAGIIVLMGFELLRDSVAKIIHPQDTQFSILVVIILIVSILVKVYMAIYNMRIAGKIDSAAMKATGTDSLGDSIATFVVLISMFVTKFTGYNIDGYCGVIVALFILYAGISAAKDTIDPLLGQPPEPKFVQSVCDIVEAQEGIIGIHDMVVHNYGPGRVMVALHAEVPADTGILDSHDIIDVTESLIKQKLNCEAVIHMDPVITDNEDVLRLKEQVKAVVMKYDEQMTMHDFRVVFGNAHTNLLFDVVVPFDYKVEDEEIKQELQQQIHEMVGTEYFIVINVDKSYV